LIFKVFYILLNSKVIKMIFEFFNVIFAVSFYICVLIIQNIFVFFILDFNMGSVF